MRGVDDFGRPSPHELSVLGWQRTGALAVLFNGADGRRPGIFEPRHLYAVRPTEEAPSVRAMRTLMDAVSDRFDRQFELEILE